jgi:hypothetical protein
MWEIFLPKGEIRIYENNHIHIDINGVKGIKRKSCCIRLILCCR